MYEDIEECREEGRLVTVSYCNVPFFFFYNYNLTVTLISIYIYIIL